DGRLEGGAARRLGLAVAFALRLAALGSESRVALPELGGVDRVAAALRRRMDPQLAAHLPAHGPRDAAVTFRRCLRRSPSQHVDRSVRRGFERSTARRLFLTAALGLRLFALGSEGRLAAAKPVRVDGAAVLLAGGERLQLALDLPR